ncbi:hypothetical protein D3C72_1452060 [compost metagenome]
MRRQRQGHRLRHLPDRPLAGPVGQLVRHRQFRGHRRQRHDRAVAPPARDHRARRGLGHQEGAAHVHVHDGVQILKLQVQEIRRPDHPRVADADVQAAPARHAIIRQRLGRSWIGHVGDVCRRTFAQRPHGLRQFGFLAVRQQHIGALVHEAPRNRQPDAARRAGDQRYLVLQFHFRLPRKRPPGRAARTIPPNCRAMPSRPCPG